MKELILKIQKQLEKVYDVSPEAQAVDFLIGDDELFELMPMNQSTILPEELFLVNPEPENDTLEVALYFNKRLSENLANNSPYESLNSANVSDFCKTIEGVSHFVYYIHKAHLNQPVSQLELELQAEVDKYILLSLYTNSNESDKLKLLELLFEDYFLQDSLTEDQKRRYHTASDLARQFCFRLSQKLSSKDLPSLLREAREFYDLSQEKKINHILK